MHITLPDRGFAPSRAAAAIRQSGLVELFTERAPGPFVTGAPSAHALTTLEHLRDAVDLGLASAEGLRGLILGHLEAGPSPFHLARLEPEHRQLIAAFQLVVTTDSLARRLASHITPPQVEGALDLDGLPELLASDRPAADLITRILRLAAAYTKMKVLPGQEQPDHAIASATLAFLHLARRATITFARQSSQRPLLAALEAEGVEVAGYPYRGLEIREVTERADGLLDISPANIVGNTEYLEAGMRLARDVAAFDFTRGRNPKQLNPVLFGLGRPGCGKTVTAHAIGNYFLDYCSARGVPARFLIIQRTDWASSYQNASALNLVRIFREEVYAREGVCGVYWPDIDTAFASRSGGQLRSEEKQNLGAVFGVFDGTLLPRDGKWFLLCDANTMHMDEATISRIAQNPMHVTGPTSPAHYTRLMRDLMLGDLASFLPLDDTAWHRVATRVATLGLSGRNVDAICRNVRAFIQDFEFPEAYFSADTEARDQMVHDLSHPADEATLLRHIDEWAEFRQEADARAEEERFQSEVETLTRQLNASRAAAEQFSG